MYAPAKRAALLKTAAADLAACMANTPHIQRLAFLRNLSELEDYRKSVAIRMRHYFGCLAALINECGGEADGDYIAAQLDDLMSDMAGAIEKAGERERAAA